MIKHFSQSLLHLVKLTQINFFITNMNKFRHYFLPDIIPLVSVDISLKTPMIIVTSKSYITVVDLITGFLLNKLHKSFDKVAFDKTHEFIIASSSSNNEISVFSLNLHLICQVKYSLDTTLHNNDNFIIDHQTQLSSSTSSQDQEYLDEITVIFNNL